MRNIWIIFKKELKDTLRDKKAMFFMLIFPLLMFPMLMLGIALIEKNLIE